MRREQIKQAGYNDYVFAHKIACCNRTLLRLALVVPKSKQTRFNHPLKMAALRCRNAEAGTGLLWCLSAASQQPAFLERPNAVLI